MKLKEGPKVKVVIEAKNRAGIEPIGFNFVFYGLLWVVQDHLYGYDKGL